MKTEDHSLKPLAPYVAGGFIALLVYLIPFLLIL